MNSAVMNIDVQVSLLYLGLHSFGWMSRSDITGSYGCSICSFLRNLYTAFHSGFINLHSHQQCIRILVSPHLCQHLLLLLPLIMAILHGFDACIHCEVSNKSV
jgi:hypothetical protein